MRRLFDVYLAIDWSARSQPSPAKPSKDAIWVGEKTAYNIVDSTVKGESYFRTRHACREYLRERLLHHVRYFRRVHIGFDFGYSFPHGYAEALGLSGNLPPWRLVWNELTRLIKDDTENGNNRFEVAAQLNARCGGLTPGPLWGCPIGREFPTLKSKSPLVGYPYPVRPELFIDRLRWVDKRVRGIQPIWKLIGSGSVGGQSLLGIPTVCQLRDYPELSSISRIWPFETGFTPTPTPEGGPFILHVEIWPGIVPDSLDPNISIRDQAQVRAYVNWLARLDSKGHLCELFDTPENLSEEALCDCVNEEGWIFGGGCKEKLSYEGFC